MLQRVKSASVTVDGKLISSIGRGLLVLAAVEKDDTDKDAASMANKILKAKLWDDEDKEPPAKWKKGVTEIGGEVLCVSQFTLLASLKKSKPSFHQSAGPPAALTMYKSFFEKVQELYEPDKVKDGIFAAMMDVALVNDGPVGLDYTCLDNEVLPQPPVDASSTATMCTTTNLSVHQVTIVIDTCPPKMDNPTSLDPTGIYSEGSSASTTIDINDLVGNMTKITKEFKIPAELLE